jgi:hypothetical protein
VIILRKLIENCVVSFLPSPHRTDANQVQNGGTPFFELVRQTVHKLDDFDSLVPTLQAAGKVQRKYVSATPLFSHPRMPIALCIPLMHPHLSSN